MSLDWYVWKNKVIVWGLRKKNFFNYGKYKNIQCFVYKSFIGVIFMYHDVRRLLPADSFRSILSCFSFSIQVLQENFLVLFENNPDFSSLCPKFCLLSASSRKYAQGMGRLVYSMASCSSTEHEVDVDRPFSCFHYIIHSRRRTSKLTFLWDHSCGKITKTPFCPSPPPFFPL